MGSTNKTTNLGLSQFIGTDKPTWLVDYNNDMAVIDEAIGELQNDSGLTDTAIAELQTNVQNLQNGQGDSATEIAEVKSDVQTLSANYEQIHHEVVLTQSDIENIRENVAEIGATADKIMTAGSGSNCLTSDSLISSKAYMFNPTLFYIEIGNTTIEANKLTAGGWNIIGNLKSDILSKVTIPTQVFTSIGKCTKTSGEEIVSNFDMKFNNDDKSISIWIGGDIDITKEITKLHFVTTFIAYPV